MEEKIDSDSTKPDNLPTFNCHACHKIFPDALEALDCIEKHMETVQTPIELKQDCQEIIESKSGTTYLFFYFQLKPGPHNNKVVGTPILKLATVKIFEMHKVKGFVGRRTFKLTKNIKEPQNISVNDNI